MENKVVKVIAVFCGSKDGRNPLYVQEAARLGKLIGESGHAIVYGGGNKGMMGALANAMLAAGGRITGIMPKILVDFEHSHGGLTEMVVTDGMHERKRMIYERCDAAIILPGGFGTLDELFEMLTWNQIRIHEKHIHILNTGDYYKHLIMHLEHMHDEGFLHDSLWERISVAGSPEELLAGL
jgi:uncharacterized protein (TIGR00730 family)